MRVPFLRRPSSATLSFLGAMLLAMLVGLIDWLTTPQVSLALFYLGPIALAVWYAGRVGGFAMALFCGLVWLTADLTGDVVFQESWVPYFNGCIRTAVFVIVAALVVRMRELTAHLEHRVKQRTQELEQEIASRERAERQLRAREAELRESEGRFRQMTDNITQMFWMTDPARTQVLYVSPAYEQIWGRTCASLYHAPRSWMEHVHPDDQERIRRAALTRQASGEYDEEYRIVRPDGRIRWVRERAFPIRTDAGVVYRIAGITEDITERRQLENQLLEISDREQARIGRDLHDGVCQALVGIAFALNLHEKKLAEQGSPESAGAHEILAMLNDIIVQSRNVARGLYPVKMDAAGLASALHELAAMIASRFKVACVFDQPSPVILDDHVVNTHLYRIAQEAVMNAIKHGQARQIQIGLSVAGNELKLTVTDDGVGLPEDPAAHRGMGLYIMQYRASLIGGALTLQRAPQGGTRVECAFRRGPAPLE
jgi:PAS domain S-box-containing protein